MPPAFIVFSPYLTSHQNATAETACVSPLFRDVSTCFQYAHSVDAERQKTLKRNYRKTRDPPINVFGSKPAALFEHTGSERPDFAIEPGDGQESVWDYPRPPSLKPDGRIVEVRSGKGIIARTTSALRMCETASPPTFYLPPDDVNTELLLPARGASVCEWKGRASYWALKSNTNEPVGWSYARPRARYRKIRNYFAFYPARLECFVDGEPVEPQPGRFYGGWITSDVVGPFKGEPGTGHW